MTIAQRFTEYLRENEFNAGIVYQVNRDIETFVDADISWGDWKHEHLRIEWLAKDFAEKNNMSVLHSCEVTEEDGSDTYSAVHHFAFVG